MYTSDFHFELPPQLIAKYPLAERSASRLLCLDRVTGAVTHRQFTDIGDYLNQGDLLIFNDTKVIPARLFGQKPTGGNVEILIERVLPEHRVLAHIRASKAPKIATRLFLENSFEVEVIERRDDLFVLQFPRQEDVFSVLENHGHMPLPPYIDREAELQDRDRYQTVYARERGAVAAPTAGLHFTDELIEMLREQGVQTAFLTLHVGAGTFQPVRVNDINQHIMHSEYCDIAPILCQQIEETKQCGKRVIAVGTTTVRSLETAARSGEMKPFRGETDIFITPGFNFKIVDAMITNFHLPQSTLLMLVAAFAGLDNTLSAYQQAIDQHYRFFSYGDAMFIE